MDFSKRLAIFFYKTIAIINEEHKIRITLSDYALSTLIEDMEIFGINKISTIIH